MADMTKKRVPRPWDELELSNGPAHKLTYQDWLVICDGDEAKARYEAEFSSDIIEEVAASPMREIRWQVLPFVDLLHGLRDTALALDLGPPRREFA